MNQATIIIALLLIAASFTAGVKVTNDSRDAELLKVVKANDDLRLKDGQEAADLIQEAQDEKRIFTTQWKTKYKTKLVYLDRNNNCHLNDDSLRTWREAITDATTKASITDAAMPTTGAID